MGTVHVDAAVRNPVEPGQGGGAPFLVGAGVEVDLRNRGLTKRSSI